MAILIAYFFFIASTLAVIVTGWIGVADSGVAGLHLQHVTAIQHSYDSSVMAENSDDAGAAPAAKAKASAPHGVASVRPQHRRPRLTARLGHEPGAEPQVALRGAPPPDDRH
jgi:uncharacterized membrane protein